MWWLHSIWCPDGRLVIWFPPLTFCLLHHWRILFEVGFVASDWFRFWTSYLLVMVCLGDALLCLQALPRSLIGRSSLQTLILGPESSIVLLGLSLGWLWPQIWLPQHMLDCWGQFSMLGVLVWILWWYLVVLQLGVLGFSLQPHLRATLSSSSSQVGLFFVPVCWYLDQLGYIMGAGKTAVILIWVSWVWVQCEIFPPMATLYLLSWYYRLGRLILLYKSKKFVSLFFMIYFSLPGFQLPPHHPIYPLR